MVPGGTPHRRSTEIENLSWNIATPINNLRTIKMRFLEVIFYGLSYRMFFENLLKSSRNRRPESKPLDILSVK